MFGTRHHPPIDQNAQDPSPVRSPFIDIESRPADLDALPDKLWPFIWYFYRQVKWPIFAMAVFVAINTVMGALIPLYAKNVIHIFETVHDKAAIWDLLQPIIVSFILGVSLTRLVTYHTARYLWAHIGWAFRAMVTGQLSHYIGNHSLKYFYDDFAGRLTQKITDTAESLRIMMSNLVFSLNNAIVTSIASLYLASITSPAYLAIFLVYMGLHAIILWIFLPKVVRRIVRNQDSKTHVTGHIVDMITNIYNVKVFAKRRHEASRLQLQLNDNARKGRYQSFAFNKMYILMDLNSTILRIAVFGLLIVQIMGNELSVADAALVVPVVIVLTEVIWWITEIFVGFLETLGSVKDGIFTLVKPFSVKDAPQAASLAVTKGEIDIQSLRFAYPGRPVFDELSLHIPAGQKIGLVGPSGAGKSTLVQLLLRLHDIQGGTINIDGQNVAEVTQDSLRNSIAVIPQSSDLLHRSIRENISYGRLDASEEDIVAAAKRAHAHEFIVSLQDRDGHSAYDATVGERGVKLSGGQRQRIAIARAILKNAPILLLDEATSALDSESERLIQESLTDLMEGRTVIAIAHRLSTIARLDRLIVMDEGRIVEDGTHQQLLAAKGLYAHLWSLQSGGFLGDGHN